jgi:phage host-nuclease inhibitor protein Gam
MREVTKVYNTEDVERLLKQVEDLSREVSGLADTMTNSKPWAAHWLGGDRDHGATEIRPARFQAALDAVRRAARDLQKADHQLAMYTVESAESRYLT